MAADPLGARGADAPRALRERCEAALVESRETTPENVLDVGTAVLGGILRQGDYSRASAGDLLAADALVTLAFERASADTGDVGVFDKLSKLVEYAFRKLGATLAGANTGSDDRRD